MKNATFAGMKKWEVLNTVFPEVITENFEFTESLLINYITN